jgi:hypothetical protein
MMSAAGLIVTSKASKANYMLLLFKMSLHFLVGKIDFFATLPTLCVPLA